MDYLIDADADAFAAKNGCSVIKTFILYNLVLLLCAFLTELMQRLQRFNKYLILLLMSRKVSYNGVRQANTCPDWTANS